jgi:DNA-binding transcriptional regulator GbsR (MarR family)
MSRPKSASAVVKAEAAVAAEQQALTAEIDECETKLERLQKRQETLADVLVQLRRTLQPEDRITPGVGPRRTRPTTPGTIKGSVAGVLERAGGAVLTAREIAARAGLSRRQVSVPLVELRHQGLVEHVGPAQYRWLSQRDANGGLSVVAP